MNYNVVSSDDHVQEPGDLWTKRVPTKLRDRAPRLERRPEGDIWMIEGKPTMGLSLSVQAGKKFEEYKAARSLGRSPPGLLRSGSASEGHGYRRR